MTLGNHRLNKSVQKLDEKKQDSETQYSGVLGLPLNGTKQVGVPGRSGYVYVRLRDNPNEVLQAFNDEVALVYGLPVLVSRGDATKGDTSKKKRRNRWIVRGRDSSRYSQGGDSSYLVRHAPSHYITGGDPVYIDTTQIVPLLVYPLTGLTVGVNGGWILCAGKPVEITATTIDFTSYLPAAGMKWALVRADVSGTVSIQESIDFPTEIPSVENGYVLLAVVNLYYGQTEISKIFSTPDVIDMRFAPRFDSGGGGTLTGVFRFDASEDTTYVYPQSNTGLINALADAALGSGDTVLFNFDASGNFTVPANTILAGQTLWGATIDGTVTMLDDSRIDTITAGIITTGTATALQTVGSGEFLIINSILNAVSNSPGSDAKTVIIGTPGATVKIRDSYLKASSANAGSLAANIVFATGSSSVCECHYTTFDNNYLSVLDANYSIRSGTGTLSVYACTWTTGSSSAGLDFRMGDRSPINHTHAGGSAHIIQDHTTPMTPRANLNFMGAGVLVTDDAGNDATIVTITGSSGGSGGHIIQNEGVDLPAQPKLNFIGQGVVASTGTNATNVTVLDDFWLKHVDWEKTQRYGFMPTVETSISFDGTGTFTLGDLGSGWSYFRTGILYSISGSKTVTVAAPMVDNTTYYIYIDATDGTLTSDTAGWTLDDTKVPVAVLRWNSTKTPKYLLSEERHTCLIDRRYHRIEHLTEGTKLVSGATLTGPAVGSDVDANKTFGLSSTVIADEDLFLTLSALSRPSGTSSAYGIVYLASGSWVWEASAMPFRYTTSGYIQFDNAGSMQEGQNNKYYNTYLCLSNISGDYRYMILHGKSEFSTASAAYGESFGSFTLNNFITNETVAVYQFTWYALASHSSKGKCVLDRVAQIRGNLVTTTVAATGIHNTLSGLQGGTTSQYYHMTATEYANLPTTLITAKGDLLAGTAAGALDNLPVGTDGQYLSALASEGMGLKWVTPLAGTSDIYSGTLLSSTTAPAGGSASITIASIPAGYDYIKIFMTGKVEESVATSALMVIEFNGDTTATNYRRGRHRGGGSDHSVSDANDNYIALLATSNAATNTGWGEITIPAPNNAAYKIAEFDGGYKSGNNHFPIQWFLTWQNTAAITDIVLKSSSDFAEGFTCVAVGYKSLHVVAAGSGTDGRIAEWDAGNLLTDSTLAKTGAGVLTLSAGSAYTLTVPATGTAALLGTAQTFTAKQTLSPTIANATANVLDITPTVTQSSTAARYVRGLYISPTINFGGYNNTGYFHGASYSILRDNATDTGALTELAGLYFAYGHYSGMPAATTSNVYGIKMKPYHQSTGSTITTMYDIFIDTAATGGTIGTHWGLYQTDANPNYLAGNLGLGISPAKKLHVAGTVLVDGDEGGYAGTIGFTDVSNTSVSSGAGAIKMCGATNRDSTGFIKIYIGTTAYYVPVFTTITG